MPPSAQIPRFSVAKPELGPETRALRAILIVSLFARGVGDTESEPL
jgi:hypothetical protein